MERLTQKCILGGWTALVPKQEVVDRLAAYEDIGLEPEEIPLVAEMQRQLEAYLAIGTVEHLSELCKAEREGRVAERPIVRCGECAQYLAKPCFCAANGTEWFPRDFCSYGTAGHEVALGGGGYEKTERGGLDCGEINY